MTNSLYKKYTRQAKAGIKGESFFESLISEYAIPHKISGSKDLGLDFICEWVFEDKPCGILFGVQIKTLSDKKTRPRSFGISGLNGLEQFRIGSSKLTVDEGTLEYWKGFGGPIYLFAIVLEDVPSGDAMNCYYKRFTPILTAGSTQEGEYFYKVNQGSSRFVAFANREDRTLGFVRDLYIDCTRWNYSRGSISYLNPRTLGLLQFPEDGVFADLFKEYRTNIIRSYRRTKRILQNLGLINET